MEEMTEYPVIKGYDQDQMAVRGHGRVIHGSDRGLFVEFYDEAVKQEYKSKTAGHPIFKKEPFIRIVSPGGYQEICRKIVDADKIRFPEHWAAYVRGAKMPVQGMPVEQWAQLDVAQVKTLKANDVHTVEQLSALSDTALQHLGVGYQHLRAQALNYVKATEENEFVAKLTSENQELKERLGAIEKKLAGQDAAEPEPAKSAPKKKEPTANQYTSDKKLAAAIEKAKKDTE